MYILIKHSIITGMNYYSEFKTYNSAVDEVLRHYLNKEPVFSMFICEQ